MALRGTCDAGHNVTPHDSVRSREQRPAARIADLGGFRRSKKLVSSRSPQASPVLLECSHRSLARRLVARGLSVGGASFFWHSPTNGDTVLQGRAQLLRRHGGGNRRRIGITHSVEDSQDQLCLSVRSSFLEGRLKIAAYRLVFNAERLRRGLQRSSLNEVNNKACL